MNVTEIFGIVEMGEHYEKSIVLLVWSGGALEPFDKKLDIFSRVGDFYEFAPCLGRDLHRFL